MATAQRWPADSNTGTIALNSVGNYTALIIGSSNVTLSGGGTVTMSSNGQNYIYGSAAANTLTNQGTIQGSGYIGFDPDTSSASMGFINDGTVLANQSTPLIIDPSSTGFTNNGVLQVNKGDTLQITGGPFSNFAGTTLTGGTYFVAGTLQFGASGSSINTNDATLTLSGATWKVVNSAGVSMLSALATNDSGAKLTVENGASYTDKTLTNDGTVDLENGGLLKINGSLTNSGAVTTNGNNAVGSANSLTVTGKLTNKTGGTVTIGDNNDTTDSASIGSFSNSGTMTVGTGAAVTLTSAATDSNTKTITVNGALDLNNNITLSGAGTLTLNAGTLAGLSTGFTLNNASTIAGSGTISNLGITNGGTLLANQSSPLVFLPSSAGLTNNGTLTVNAGSTMQIGTSAGGALTNFDAGTLTGGTYKVTGTLQFGASTDTITTNAANITLSGTGQMLNFGNTNLLAGFNNNLSGGVFKLASGASLTTNGGSFTNAGAFTISTGTTFTIGGSSFNYTQTGGSTTVAGTLTSSSLGTVNLDGGTSPAPAPSATTWWTTALWIQALRLRRPAN